MYHSRFIATLILPLAASSALASDTRTGRLLVHFDGSLAGTAYTMGAGEFVTDGTFAANGTPTITGGHAALDGTAAPVANTDGFKYSTTLGSLAGTNWVAESIVSFDAFGTGQRTMIDVQGDTDFRINNGGTALQAGYWDGTTTGFATVPLPATGTYAHYAVVWDAATTSLTAYVNGELVGTVNNAAHTTPDASNISFGYLGRTGVVGRGIDGTLDSVSFATFTGAFNPAVDFDLYTPPEFVYRYWDTNGATAGAGTEHRPVAARRD